MMRPTTSLVTRLSKAGSGPYSDKKLIYKVVHHMLRDSNARFLSSFLKNHPADGRILLHGLDRNHGNYTLLLAARSQSPEATRVGIARGRSGD